MGGAAVELVASLSCRRRDVGIVQRMRSGPFPDLRLIVLGYGTDLALAGIDTEDLLEATLYVFRSLGRHQIAGYLLKANLFSVGRNREGMARPNVIRGLRPGSLGGKYYVFDFQVELVGGRSFPINFR